MTRGPGVGSPILLGETVLTIGRDLGAALLLNDVAVSRRHAEVRPAADGYEIADAGSLNGTYVNGRSVEVQLLVDGDEVQIGRFKLAFLQVAPRQPRR